MGMNWPTELRKRNLAAITALLDAANIQYLVHSPRSATRTAVIVNSDDRKAIIEVLNRSELRAAEMSGERINHIVRRVSDSLMRKPNALSIALMEQESHAVGGSIEDVRYATELEFWSQAEDQVFRSPLKANNATALATLEPNTEISFSELGSFTHIDDENPRANYPSRHELNVRSTVETTLPIDAVYTWVDGDDVAWQNRRESALSRRQEIAWHLEASSPARYLDQQELRYSLRSIRMYAPWIRNIYIVTDRQHPEWLGLDASNVRVIDHSEIFRDNSVLPVFNSHAIETQLHHIPNLSNNFLYLNDDMFLGAPVVPEDFVTPAGLSRVFLSRNSVLGPELVEHFTPVDAAFDNVRELVSSEFGATPMSTAIHAPYSLRVDILNEMEQRFEIQWNRTMASRERSREDISPTSSFYQHYALCTGRAVVGSISYTYFNLGVPDRVQRMNRLLGMRASQAICLNASDTPEKDEGPRQSELNQFLEAYYPLPTSFEANE